METTQQNICIDIRSIIYTSSQSLTIEKRRK